MDVNDFDRNNPAHREALEKEIHRLKLDCDGMNGRIIAMSCGTGVLATLIINEPASFIVEERPLTPSEPPTSIERSISRPHYIVLKPKQIRQRFIYPNGEPDDEERERIKRCPHERRGHFRRLMSEKFVHARGQVKWIKPMWIGPSEAVVGKNRYTVRLDL